MGSRVDLGKDAPHRSIRTNDVGDTPRMLVTFRLAGPVRDSQRALRIAQQAEGKVELGSKGGVLVHAIE